MPITLEDGNNNLVNTIDNSGNRRNTEYVLKIVKYFPNEI